MCNESQDHLVMLLNQLCSRLRDNIELVEIFFRSSDKSQKGEKFVIFTILLRFLHSDGHVGSRARDALLLCISLSKSHDGIGDYIANGTDFCHVSHFLQELHFLRQITIFVLTSSNLTRKICLNFDTDLFTLVMSDYSVF